MAASPTAFTPAPAWAHDAAMWGLEPDEVQARVRAGAVNRTARRTSRSVAEIVRDNLLTRFNAILGVLLLVTLVVGPLQDASFGFILLANGLIGIGQELHAKRTLDHLALVAAARVRVVRGGRTEEVAVDEVVVDDVVDLGPGDQAVVDGEVLESRGLAMDEALLTGESEPEEKPPGSTVLSGSFVVAGSGRCRATRVGAAAYAESVAAQARRFGMAPSALRRGVDRLLTLAAWAMVPTGVVLVIGQFRSGLAPVDAVRTSVAGMVAMIPAGLVLLTSVAFAASVLRLARRDTLAQELQSVETLARVDVVCFDKTGTLTEERFAVEDVEDLGGGVPFAAALGALAAAETHPNATLQAIAARFPAGGAVRVRSAVPFASGRGWSAVDLEGAAWGTWVLGAPEVLLAAMPSAAGVRARVDQRAAAGSRVVLLARSDHSAEGGALPQPLAPVVLVALSQRLRRDAAETVAWFAGQGVDLRVISGDSPATAAAIARRAGIAATEPCDARTLGDGEDSLAAAAERHTVFGRVAPERKRELVAALQSRGHVVAMVGDGVNDVLALKQADMGVAMRDSTPAARAVSQIALLGEGFAALPAVVAEGRRVIAGVERASRIYATETVYGMLLAWAVGVAAMPFPFLSRHLTLVISFTVGIPSFFLALAPSGERARSGFALRVLSWAIPAGVVTAVATFATYRLALGDAPATTLDQARTAAAIVLCGIGLWLLTALDRPMRPDRLLLAVSMAALFAIAFAMPFVRGYFGLDAPRSLVWLAAAGVFYITVSGIEVSWWLVERLRHRVLRA